MLKEARPHPSVPKPLRPHPALARLLQVDSNRPGPFHERRHSDSDVEVLPQELGLIARDLVGSRKTFTIDFSSQAATKKQSPCPRKF
jgi:hypothetical protein